MSGRVILVTAVGEASGSKAAAAALACAGSEPDLPGLLIDVGGRPPRPTLVSSTGARELEVRLAAHLPHLRAASRGQICHLAVDDDPGALESVSAALPLARESVAVVHLPPAILQGALVAPGVRAHGALLRADLNSDRALTALVARDLLNRSIRVAVLKRPLAWVSARRALFGMLAPGALPARPCRSLLEGDISMEHPCHVVPDDEDRAPQQRSEGMGT